MSINGHKIQTQNKQENPGNKLPGFHIRKNYYAATAIELTNLANFDFWLDAFFL
jgi:hypothetical protein